LADTLWTVYPQSGNLLSIEKERKVDLYSAYRQYNSTTKRSHVDHTELAYLQIHHICLSFVYTFARGRNCC